MLVQLGNLAPRDVDASQMGNRVTTLVIPDDLTTNEAVRTVTDPDGAWGYHSTQPPAWVESDNSDVADQLAAHFTCPVGRPADWKDDQA